MCRYLRSLLLELSHTRPGSKQKSQILHLRSDQGRLQLLLLTKRLFLSGYLHIFPLFRFASVKIMAQFDEIPPFLGRTQNLMPQDEVKYEFMAAADDNVMLFFASWIDNSKILIVYDPD